MGVRCRILRYFTGFFGFLVGATWLSPLWGESNLNFPVLGLGENSLMGIAVVNPTGTDAVLEVTAFGEDGDLLAGDGLTNPASVTIPAGQQLARLTSELFGRDFPEGVIGWIQAVSPVPGLTGFFILLDGSLNGMDGADLPPLGLELAFNQVRLDGGHSTVLNVFNPNSQPAQVELRLEMTGDLQSLAGSRLIPPKGAIRLDVADFFETSAVRPETYVLVTSSVPVGGFAVVKNPQGEFLGLNARRLDERLTQMYFPQLAVLGGFQTEIGLVNYSPAPAIVTISAHQSNGQLYGPPGVMNNPITRALPPRAGLREDVAEMFGFTGEQPLDGWLKVESTAPAVNGYIVYTLTATGATSAVVVGEKGQTRALFSHLATTLGYFTGIAALNPGALAANLQIVAMKPDGEVLGTYSAVLQPRHRFSRLLTELIPAAAGQAGGWIWVKSNLPVYLSSVFGTGNVISNIPPQEAPPGFEPLIGPPPRISPPLGVLPPNGTLSFQAEHLPGALSWQVNEIPGGNAALGTVDGTGTYRAPAQVPIPLPITLAARSGDEAAGASIDILTKAALIQNLGVIQSIAYLSALQRLFTAELIALSPLEGVQPLGADPANAAQTEIFQVTPTVRLPVITLPNESVSKMIPFQSSAGTEFLLMTGRDTGRVIRLDPVTNEIRTVATGLNQPNALVLDPVTGDLLVAEADRITTVPRSQFDSGSGTAEESVPQEEAQPAAVLLPTTGASGIAVDRCSGLIYLSDAEGGQILEFDRTTGEVRVIVTGLVGPTQLLAIYRKDVSCPESLHLLVAEPDADRITLIIPSQDFRLQWFSAPGVRDLIFLPESNPFTQSAAVAFTELVGTLTSDVSVVEIFDLYEMDPPNPPPSEPSDETSCIVPFTDTRLAAAVRTRLGLPSDAPVPCDLAESVESLEAVYQGIRDLTGMEFFTNLRDLNLGGNSISDPGPLAGLTGLRRLVLSFNPLGNPLVSLAGLISLEVLHLSDTGLSDVGALSGLTGLRALGLERNRITDLSPLRGLQVLEYLSLADNGISDIDTLAELTSLTELLLEFNQIRSIDPLLANPGLGQGDRVDLTTNPLPPAECENLHALAARGVEVIYTAPCGADLAITKSGFPDPVEVGGLITHTLTVTNLGPSDASQVRVTDQLSPGSIFQPGLSSPACRLSQDTVICDVGFVAAGLEVSVDIVVTAPASPGQIVNYARVTSEQPDHDLTNNTAFLVTTVGVGADLSITKSDAVDPVIVFDPIEYTITVTNLGPSTATSVQVLDILPPDVFFEVASGTGWSCIDTETPDGTEVLCDLAGPLAAGTSSIITMEVFPSDVGVVTNTVTVSAAEPDPEPANNTAIEETTVEPILIP